MRLPTFIKKILGMKNHSTPQKPNGEDKDAECVTEIEALEAENEIFNVARQQMESIGPMTTVSINLAKRLKELEEKHDADLSPGS